MNNYFEKNLGQLISYRRNELGLSQEQLADRLNMSRSHIARIEQGRSAPPLKTLINMNNVLNMNLLDNDLISKDIEGISPLEYKELSVKIAKSQSTKQDSSCSDATIIIYSSLVRIKDVILINKSTGEKSVHSIENDIPNKLIHSVNTVNLS